MSKKLFFNSLPIEIIDLYRNTHITHTKLKYYIEVLNKNKTLF